MQSMRSARPVNAQQDPQREMAAALAADELVLHFQPIVVLGSGRIRGVEALVRWRRADGTLLMPDDFLSAIAHTPMMSRVTAWVVDQACAQAAVWDDWTMSINVAAIDVARPALVEVVQTSLRRHRVPASHLVVELTEHAAVQGLETANDVLQDLRDAGVGVALDDFGTGYSSLLYLRDLPVTEVKIDRTFVSGVERGEDDAAIVNSVVTLASTVGLSVVAEGVETSGQARYLQSIGCSCAQGYRYARPAPASAVPHELNSTLFDPYPVVVGRPPEPASPQVVRRIAALISAGASLHTIAAALNRDGLLTSHDRRWTAAAVARVCGSTPMR